MSFEATCTGCGRGEVLTVEEADKQVDPRGYFLCVECQEAGKTVPDFKRPRSRVGIPQASRRLGCIVTAMLPDGTLVSYTEAGKTTEALEAICSRLPDGSHVETVSTYRTIIADMKNSRRRDSHDRRFDPWATERAMLAKIGRLDLLPERAEPDYLRKQERV